jgi:hypothetical protein
MHEPDGDVNPNPDFGLRGCKAAGRPDQLDGADLDPRWPLNGPRPVVSVSMTISRIVVDRCHG